MSDHLTIKQAQEEVKRFIDAKGKDWTQIDNHFYLFTHLSEEIGELARDIIDADTGLFAMFSRKRLSFEEARQQVEDDLGDVLYHLFKLAIAYNVDLGGAFEKAMKNIRKKYGKT